MADMSMHAASDLLQRVGELAMDAKQLHADLEALQLSAVASDGERMIYLALAEAIEHGLAHTIEAARDAIKGMRVTEAEVWLRRRLQELDET